MTVETGFLYIVFISDQQMFFHILHSLKKVAILQLLTTYSEEIIHTTSWLSSSLLGGVFLPPYLNVFIRFISHVAAAP